MKSKERVLSVEKVIKVKDVAAENQENKETYFIHLEKEKKDKFDPLTEIIWEGWLKDIPDEYMECEVLSSGESLRDAEQGRTGFYLEIKMVECSGIEKVFERLKAKNLPMVKSAYKWYEEYKNGDYSSGYLLQGFFYGLSAANVISDDELTTIVVDLQKLWGFVGKKL